MVIKEFLEKVFAIYNSETERYTTVNRQKINSKTDGTGCC